MAEKCSSRRAFEVWQFHLDHDDSHSWAVDAHLLCACWVSSSALVAADAFDPKTSPTPVAQIAIYAISSAGVSGYWRRASANGWPLGLQPVSRRVDCIIATLHCRPPRYLRPYRFLQLSRMTSKTRQLIGFSNASPIDCGQFVCRNRVPRGLVLPGDHGEHLTFWELRCSMTASPSLPGIERVNIWLALR